MSLKVQENEDYFLEIANQYLKSPFELMDFMFKNSYTDFFIDEYHIYNLKFICTGCAILNEYGIAISLTKDEKFKVIPLGIIKKEDEKVSMIFDKRFFKRHLYNCAEIENYKNEICIFKNLEFLDNIPDKVLNKSRKDFLFNSNKVINLDKLKLKSYFVLELNLSNNKLVINYYLELYENLNSSIGNKKVKSVLSEYYKVADIEDFKFKKFLSVYLDNFVFKIFNKEYNKLNKEEIKLLELYLH